MNLAAAASFSSVSLVAPGLRLLTGPRCLLAAGFAWTLAHLPPPAPLVVVDCGENVDRHLLLEVAGYLGEAPGDLAGRVHLGRAYTPQQVVTLLEAASAESVREAGRHTLVLLPFDLFAREPMSPREASGLVARLVRSLEALGRPPGSLVVVCPDVPRAGALGRAVVERVASFAAAHHRFEVDRPAGGDETPEKRGPSFARPHAGSALPSRRPPRVTPA